MLPGGSSALSIRGVERKGRPPISRSSGSFPFRIAGLNLWIAIAVVSHGRALVPECCSPKDAPQSADKGALVNPRRNPNPKPLLLRGCPFPSAVVGDLLYKDTEPQSSRRDGEHFYSVSHLLST